MSNLHFSEKAQVKDHGIYKLQKLRRKGTGANQDQERVKILVFHFKVLVSTQGSKHMLYQPSLATDNV